MTAILGLFLPCMFGPSAPATSKAELKKQQALEQIEKDKEKFEKNNLPQEVCEQYPECARFLIDSGFLYSIGMFKNGPQEHDIRLSGSDNHPLIKMNGEWQRWDYIEAHLEYDKETARVITKGEPSIGWNYISPDGFVQKDVYNYNAIYPIEQIGQEDYRRLLNHAEKYWDKNPEVDPGQLKDCIFQITTTQRKGWGPLQPSERSWMTENMLDNMPGHTSIRVIDPTGNVYAFGTLMPEDQSGFSSSPFVLTSAQVNITTIDYEEARADFESRKVTSMPMTQERAKAILNFVTQSNKEGIRFNFLRQPCVKVNTVIARMAGMDVDAKTTVGGIMGSLLPDITKLPVISHIAAAVSSIKDAVSPIFETIAEYVPPVKYLFSAVASGYEFVTRKLSTLTANTFIAILGGTKMTCSQWGAKKHESHAEVSELAEFDCLINSWSDFFDETTADGYHSSILAHWQDTQPSTVIYKYEGPKLYLLPPQEK